MSAVLQIQPTWVLTDIIAAAGQPLDQAYTADDRLYLPDVSQVDADAALAAYDNAASQEAKEWSLVRVERNAKLLACDWTQLPDIQLSDTEKESWRTYRQALRDIPTTYVNAETMEDITWPSEPT